MKLEEILKKYKSGEIDLSQALEQFPDKGIEEMGFATIDTDRESRTGLPEVIYGSGKTIEQVKQIAERMHNKGIDKCDSCGEDPLECELDEKEHHEYVHKTTRFSSQ